MWYSFEKNLYRFMELDWIYKYQVFLFDFDGLLVNTEHLHCEAYRRMCLNRGYQLDWDFHRFCVAAHLSATGLRQGIYEQFPMLQMDEPVWEVLYEEKKQAYLELLESGQLALLPGAEELLIALQQAGMKRGVVTNSTQVQIETIKKKFPVLDTLPVWVTREDYQNPKPSPEGYQLAIRLLAREGDRMIGFEDSLKGLQALLQAGAKGVLVCPPDHPQLDSKQMPSVPIFSSFLEMRDL